MNRNSIDLDRLLKSRLIVARFGEMDLAKWWNTKGQLGRLGATALRRGFPRTHYFAQARSVFAVASHRCAEWFDPPRCVTLWRLPEEIEEEFEARWEQWLDNANEWPVFFEELAAVQAADFVSILRSFDLVTERSIEGYTRLRRSAEGRSVQLPGVFGGSLAIAHGLEDVFWLEGSDSKWKSRAQPTRSIEDLVHERTSPAVKAALKSLTEAPVARLGGNGRRPTSSAANRANEQI